MGYLCPQQFRELELRLGSPDRLVWRHAITADEHRMVRASQKHGRAHDVTLFIRNGEGELAVISKHSFPDAAFRAPSGGVEPGEDIIAGAQREAWEETGLRVEVQRWLLQVDVTFYAPQAAAIGSDIEWRTIVLLAAGKGELQTRDPTEIRDVRWTSPRELQGAIRDAMWNSGRPLLRYRVRLTDEVMARL